MFQLLIELLYLYETQIHRTARIVGRGKKNWHQLTFPALKQCRYFFVPKFCIDSTGIFFCTIICKDSTGIVGFFGLKFCQDSTT